MSTLDYLKNRTGEINEDLLQTCIDDAENLIKEYCGITTVPETLAGTVKALALRSYNRLGIEGFSSFGEPEGASLGLDDLTKSDISRLNRHRVPMIL